MKKAFTFLTFFCSLMLVQITAVAAPDFIGRAFVNVTSDTAATAKKMAMSEARRQIISEAAGQYANIDSFSEPLKEAKDEQLIDLIKTTSIENEKQSATTYSADVIMTVDAKALEKWFNDNDIQNWMSVSDVVPANSVIASIEVTSGLRDWIELNRAFRDVGVMPNTRRIVDGKITVAMPEQSRAKFITAVRSRGWMVTTTGGDFLRVSK